MARPQKPIDVSTQAGRIVKRFGSVKAVHEAMARHPMRDPPNVATIYRWLARGHVPHDELPYIEAAAKAVNIRLTPLDFDPRTL